MSNNIVPIAVCKSIDSVVNFEKLAKRQYAVTDCGSQVSYQTYLAQNVNNQTIQITTLPPSETTAIDPMQIKAHVKYLLTFTGTSVSGNLLQVGQSDSPRFMPFNNTCNTQTVQINGQSISTLTNQWLPALSRYEGFYDQLSQEFTAPTQLDECTDYSNLFGLNRSPMALFGENTYQKSRGGFSGIRILTNTPTSATVELSTTEPILIPAIYYNEYGLINVRNLTWLFTFGDLRRVWSHDAVNGNNITNLSVDIQDFRMSFRFITPKILAEKIPRSVVYSYHEIVPINQQSGVSVAPNGSGSISISSINLQAIPKDFIFWVAKPQSLQLFTDADSAMRIDNISCNFMNRTGLLASATIESLHDITIQNGCNSSWDMYNKYNGSYVRLNVARNLGLDSLLSSGLLINPQWSLTVNFTNIGLQTYAPMLYCQVLYEGAMTINADGSMNKTTAVLSSSDVLNAQLEGAPVVESKHEHFKSFYGGDLLSDMVDVGKDLVNLGKHSFNVGTKVAPLLGLGGGHMIGGKKHRKRRGGDMIDRAEIGEYMDEY